jgi:hypothetical protein
VRKGLETAGLDSQMLELFDAEVIKATGNVSPPTRKKKFGPSAAAPASLREEDFATIVGVEIAKPRAADLEPVSGPEPKPPAPRTTPRLPPRVAPTPAAAPPAKLAPSVPTVASAAPVRKSVARHFAPGSKVLMQLKNSNWKTRQDALASIDGILLDANSYITGNVGNELMPALRARFGDSNRNLAAIAYGVVGRLGCAMGPGAAIHVKNIMPQVLSNGCVDIKNSVRDAAMLCLDLWYQACGLAPIIPYLGLPVVSLNSNFRKDYLEWLGPRLAGKVGSFDPAKENLSVLVDPCVVCLRDKTEFVRQFAEVVLQNVIASVGFAAVERKVTALSKSSRLQLEPIIAKYREGAICDTAPPTAVPATAGTTSRLNPRTTPRQRPQSVVLTPRTPAGRQRPPFDDVDNAPTPRSGLRRPRPASVQVAPSASKLQAPQGGYRTSVRRGYDMGGHGQPMFDPEPDPVSSFEVEREHLLAAGPGKISRSERVAARKSNVLENYPDDGVPGVELFVAEQADDLASDLHECVSESLFSKMIAPANRFQLHVEAIESIQAAMSDEPDILVSCADVLLRWAVLRIDDVRTPPTMLMKASGFISSVCEVLLSSGSSLADYELSAVVPVLVEKCGSNRNVVRESMQAALLSIGDVTDDRILIRYLVDSMWRTASTRSKFEIATVLPQIIDRMCSGGVEFPEGVLTVTARVAYGPDDASGRAATMCIDRAHQALGDDVWALIGEVSDAEAELLESRFAQVVNPPGGGATDEDISIKTPAKSPKPRRTVAPVPSVAGAEKNPFVTGSEISCAVTPDHLSFPTSAIRSEDFRLSVAPAPPSSVVSALGDSLAMQTPMRPSRPAQEMTSIGNATPALPSRRPRGGIGNFSFISSQKSSLVLSVIDLLESQVHDEQVQGLDIMFDDFNAPRSTLLNECARELLPLLSCGFRDCVERLEVGSNSRHETALLKKFLNALMAYVREPNVICSVGQSSIEQLLSDILDAMIPDEMPSIGDDWERVRRGVNLAVLKILETCDCNLLYTALFNLLLAELRISTGDGDDTKPSAKTQLLIKSAAKVSKRGFSGVAVDCLLRDLNIFLTSLSSSGDPLDADGEPLRLVRTVVDAVAEEIGAKMHDNLTLVPSSDSSPLIVYIKSVISPEIANLRANVVVPEESDYSTEPGSPVRDARGMTAIDGVIYGSDATDPQDKLAGIFDHLVSSSGKDSGLRRLRAFMMCHPDVDISPHVKKCSSFLQTYVREGLEKITDEDTRVELNLGETGLVTVSADENALPRQVSEVSVPQEGQKLDNEPLKSATSIVSGSDSDRESRQLPPKVPRSDTAGQAYLKRLRDIQARYGLPEKSADAGIDGSDDHAKASGSAAEVKDGEGRSAVAKEVAASLSVTVSDTRDKATALRERMARIRQSTAE